MGTIIEQVSFTWDGTILCEQTTESRVLPHPVTLTWDHNGLRPVAQTERILSGGSPQEAIDERFFSIVTDLVGTPSELVTETGTIAWSTRSTLWGKTTWATSSSTYTPLRYPGQYFDPETSLHYNFYRHEMNSKPTRFHFHKETWTFISPTNTWIVDNAMVRVPLGSK
ncbi:hypothetical protein RKD30_005420 [Streptomyces pristinaespiralis]